MNWYKISNLQEHLKTIPKSEGLIHFLASLGFDENGKPIKYKEPKRTKKEHEEALERWDEMEHEHGSA